MARLKGSFTAKLAVKAKKVKTSEPKFKELEIKSGVFSDTQHYAKNISAQGLYSVLLYGTKDGRIPSRNVLDFLVRYIEQNREKYVGSYLKNIDDVQSSGQYIGTDINNKHKRLIYGLTSPGNAPSTIKKKGFNNPLIDKGVLVKSIAFSINRKGRYGKG